MKIYYLKTEDSYAIFFSEEKAIEDFNTIAKDNGWTNIRITKDKEEGYTVIDYNYDDGYSDYATITEFTVGDPDN